MLTPATRCHIVPTPAGTHGFVGSIPFALGDKVPATSNDVSGGRAWTSEKTGVLVTIKFPSFPSAEEANKYALGRGVEIVSFKGETS